MAGRTSSEPLASADGISKDEEVAVAVEEAITLGAFLDSRKQQLLGFDECLTIVDAAIRLFEGLYVHLPLKRAMYAVDPVRRLRLLQLRLERFREAKLRLDRGGLPLPGEPPLPPDDLWFHREMSDTFTSVRDLHTTYVLPEPFNRAVAFLPFQVEDYFDGDERRFMVSNVVDGLEWFTPPDDFVPGVEITHWSGIPIQRAVELAGERNAGNNPDARLARGLARLTVRPLAKSLPPDEEWVCVDYTCASGRAKPLRVGWRVARLRAGQDVPADGAVLRSAMAKGLDDETDVIRLLRRDTYGPRRRNKPGRPWLRDQGTKAGRSASIRDLRAFAGVPEFFQAKIFAMDRREYGYIRIRSFKEIDHEAFLAGFIDLVERMPKAGLIIDVRDNPGGHILTGERLLQVLTPETIQPERFQFINSGLSLELCGLLPEYWPWAASVRRALETSATFSSSVPLSPSELCNDKGQRYYGPVVLITNALCYSTTDIFAAGFQDHKVGLVLGTDGRTGAGGAEVVTYSALRRRHERVSEAAVAVGNAPPAWPLGDDPLPFDADLRVAIRRASRVGEQSGVELEDLGVVVDQRHRMSANDVLGGNVDLIAAAATLLSGMASYELREVTIAGSRDPESGPITAEIETRGIGWLDVSVDGWAAGSQPVQDGRNAMEVRRPRGGGPAKLLELRGYQGEGGRGKLVAGRKIDLATTLKA